MKEIYLINDQKESFSFTDHHEDGEVTVEFDGHSFRFSVDILGDHKLLVGQSKGHKSLCFAHFDNQETWLSIGAKIFHVTNHRPGRQKKSTGPSDMKAPMTGKIAKIVAQEGMQVEKGAPLVILEAMKMEHVVKASKSGTIDKILVAVGEIVEGGSELVLLKDE